MNRDDIIRMAKEAGAFFDGDNSVYDMPEHCFERLAALVAAAERKKVAAWMHFNDYTTGHGDCIEDLLEEIQAQAAESERWKCAEVAESYEPTCDTCPRGVAAAIRARGESNDNRQL